AETKNNFWFITAVWLVVKNNEIPDWQEFRHVNINYILSRKEKLKNNLPVYQSYPDWLWELGTKELGAEIWTREAVAMNEQAPVFLRANTLKTSAEKLLAELKAQNIESELISNNALKLMKRENV